MRTRFGARGAAARARARLPTANLKALERSVRDAVRDHQPRVRLVDVTVTQDPVDPVRVDIELIYTVRHSDTSSAPSSPLPGPSPEACRERPGS